MVADTTYSGLLLNVFINLLIKNPSTMSKIDIIDQVLFTLLFKRLLKVFKRIKISPERVAPTTLFDIIYITSQ